MNYTLHQYFEEAQVTPIPDWFRHVELWFYNKDTGQMEPGKPRWHQITGLNMIMSHTRSGLFDDMGTGKSCQMQAAAIWYADAGNKVICLMPPILIQQFIDSIHDTFRGLPPTIRIEAYRGTVAKRNKLVERWQKDGAPHIVVTTYELFRKEFPIFQTMNYEVVMADECRLLSNPNTETYSAIELFLGKYGEKALVLANGTPAYNQLVGLYGYIELLTPWAYMGLHDFYIQHVDVEDITVNYRDKEGNDRSRSVEKITGYRNKELLYKNLYAQARRVETHEVQELPELNIIPMKVEMEDRHWNCYKQFVEERIMLFPDGTMINGTNASSLRQKCGKLINSPEDFQLKTEAANLQMAEQIMGEIDLTQNKVVVFAYYRQTVEKLAKKWAKWNPAVIYGGGNNNEAEKNRFLNKADCRIAIINYESGGVGLNLQRDCHNIICVETIGIPGAFMQAIKRVHRQGQKHNVNVYVLIAKGTLAVNQYRDMTSKKEEIDQVVSRDKLKAELLGEDIALQAA